MTKFNTKYLPVERDAAAPDGSDVRLLLGLRAGGMAHLEIGPNQTSKAAVHRTVEEIWLFLSGRGQMRRMQDGYATVMDVYAGICLTILLGTHFQFQSVVCESLSAIGVMFISTFFPHAVRQDRTDDCS